MERTRQADTGVLGKHHRKPANLLDTLRIYLSSSPPRRLLPRSFDHPNIGIDPSVEPYVPCGPPSNGVPELGALFGMTNNGNQPGSAFVMDLGHTPAGVGQEPGLVRDRDPSRLATLGAGAIPHDPW